jgi:hypothetical protein
VHAVSSNTIIFEKKFPLVRSKQSVFIVAEWAGMYQMPFWSKINAKQENKQGHALCQQGRKK